MEHVFEENLYYYEPNIVLIMAGGLGKRMNSDLPKVLHTLNDLPLIVHVVNSALQIDSSSIIYIIVGKYRELIENAIVGHFGSNRRIKYVEQLEPLGTGHAIQCCREKLVQYDGNSKVLILSGDVPLFSAKYMRELMNRRDKATIVTTHLDEPFGYGRIVENGEIIKIVEEKDCTDEEKCVNRVNCGIYAFENDILCKCLPFINNKNSQQEYYLTSIIEIMKTKIGLFEIPAENQYEICGINTPEQLELMRSKTI
jgi:UDP-N-acetylglucosamine diphosphorylase/glucosamine-1-phosphate N-acetyltransferase